MDERFAKALDIFESMKSKDYGEKVKYSLGLVENKIAEYNDKIVVSCSFGKDSMAILHMARIFDKDILVAFANTGVEYPQTIEFKKQIVESWELNYFEAVPIKTFWECVEEYGYPKFRGSGKGRDGSTPKCCIYTKEKPLYNFYKEKGIRAVIIGLSFDESYQRKWVMIRYKDHYKTKSHMPNLMEKIYPLAYWKTSEVWQYTYENNIPVNPAYNLVDRIGCMPCTGHKYWQEQMSIINPKMYEKVRAEWDGQSLIDGKKVEWGETSC